MTFGSILSKEDTLALEESFFILGLRQGRYPAATVQVYILKVDRNARRIAERLTFEGQQNVTTLYHHFAGPVYFLILIFVALF